MATLAPLPSTARRRQLAAARRRVHRKVIDTVDAALADDIRATGMGVVVADTRPLTLTGDFAPRC